MNRDIFFSEIRRTVFNGRIAPTAFTAIDEILRQGQGLPAEHLAYIMATAVHEAGHDLVPKRENLNYTSTASLRRVWPSRFPTTASARPYVRQPQKLANYVYGGRLGNDTQNDGWTYRGAGLAQITGEENFRKFGLDKDPTKALELEVAVDILIRGLRLGMFTGRRLSNYALPNEFRQAREIVNADVAANGNKVAGVARAFLNAFTKAGYTILSQTTDPEDVEDTPEVTQPETPDHTQPVPEEEWVPALTVPEYLDIIETSVAAVRKLLSEK